MFAPGAGVAEDPATGSAAGPLALHLARHGRIAFGEEIEISQGAEIGRPSTLYARVDGSASDRARRGRRLGRHRRARRVQAAELDHLDLAKTDRNQVIALVAPQPQCWIDRPRRPSERVRRRFRLPPDGARARHARNAEGRLPSAARPREPSAKSDPSWFRSSHHRVRARRSLAREPGRDASCTSLRDG